MAYIKPNMNVFFANNGKSVTAVIERVSFRKYWGTAFDKETGKKVKKRKSMPFACCKVLLSSDPTVRVGEEFLIAGYKLRNVVMKNERMLTFKSDCVAEYSKEYGSEWARKIINEDR
tara:strand:- start:526 stop:876 length:351 start_codon:yes stop_codon:yes gene_type:complete